MNFAVTVDEIAAVIRKVGVESTIITTDFGSHLVTTPVDGMREYLTKLTTRGFGLKEINHMTGENPAELLDI